MEAKILEYTKHTTPEAAREANTTFTRNALREEIRECLRYLHDGIKLAREFNLGGDDEKTKEDFMFLCKWFIKFGLNNE